MITLFESNLSTIALNARLMKTKSTGSGRRENYRHIVLPRMRNTMMLSGKQTQEEMIKAVDKGISHSW